jgi:hypothetical protein
LLTDSETTLPTPHAKLRVAKANARGNGSLIEEVERWLDGDSATEPARVRAQLQTWVPEYAPAAGSSEKQ